MYPGVDPTEFTDRLYWIIPYIQTSEVKPTVYQRWQEEVYRRDTTIEPAGVTYSRPEVFVHKILLSEVTRLYIVENVVRMFSGEPISFSTMI